MTTSLPLRSGLTVLWAVAILVFLRLWDLTNLVPVLAGWACVFLVAYVAMLVGLEGSAALRRRGELSRLVLWLVVIALALTGALAVPTVQVRSAMAHTTVFVRVIDTVLPLWIAARAGWVLWTGPARALVLAAYAGTFALGLWGFVVRMPGRSFSGPLPPLAASEVEVAARLEGDVRALADSIGERHYRRPEALADAASWITRGLEAAGRQVRADTFTVDGRAFHNLEVVIPGTERPEEIVVIGAHYDTAEGTPGADDNASGVAVLLELARGWQGTAFARTVKLVAFANEEPPFFNTDGMGSRVYAARSVAAGDRVAAMLSLETVGYYSDAEDSQAYPPPFSMLYPSVGNFVGFVGNLASRSLVTRTLGTFRRVASLPSEGISAPTGVPGVDWSDQQAFWRHGIPGLMITDTAPFRYAQYHYRTDTPDRLDYGRMARLVTGLRAVVADLAGGAPGAS